MNKIERPNMTEGDVIEFTLRDQRHTAVVMLMTDDDIVLLDLVDGDRPAWAGISTLQRSSSLPDVGARLASKLLASPPELAASADASASHPPGSSRGSGN
jgi:hypothetical protein